MNEPASASDPPEPAGQELIERQQDRQHPSLWEWGLMSVLMILAIALRTRSYLGGRAMWLDELFLMENINNRDLAGMFRPLSEDQVATPGFMAWTKLLEILIHDGAWVMRLTPYVSGLILPFFVWWFVRRALGAVAGIVVLLLLAIHPYLIFYSAELKPYGMDVFFTFAMVYCGWRLLKSYDMKSCMLFVIVALIGVVFSLTSVFGITATGMTIGLPILWRIFKGLKNKQAIKPEVIKALSWALCLAIPAGLFLIQYVLVISHYRSSDNLFDFWVRQGGFAPRPWFTPEWFAWWGFIVFRWMLNPLGVVNNWDGPNLGTPLMIPVWVYGAWCLYKKDKGLFSLSMLPVLFLIIGGLAGKYPAVDRVVLFTLPSFAMPLAALADEFCRAWSTLFGKRVSHGEDNKIERAPEWSFPRLAGWLTMLIVATGLIASYLGYTEVTTRRFYEPWHHARGEQLHWAMYRFEEKHEPGEKIFVFFWSGFPYRYYDDKTGVPEWGSEDVVPLFRADAEIELLAWQLLAQAPREGRVWVVFSHWVTYFPIDECKETIKLLESHGVKMLEDEEISEWNARIIPMDFSEATLPEKTELNRLPPEFRERLD